ARGETGSDVPLADDRRRGGASSGGSRRRKAPEHAYFKGLWRPLGRGSAKSGPGPARFDTDHRKSIQSKTFLRPPDPGPAARLRERAGAAQSKESPMYAVIKTGGKQYKVAPGEKLKVELLAADVGAEVTLDALLIGDGDTVRLGQPTIEGAAVKATV